MPGNDIYNHNRACVTLSFVTADGRRFMGNSVVLNTVADKDTLVSTLAKYSFSTQDLLYYIPESILIPFDVLATNFSAPLPALPSVPCLLKMPMGSSGDGVYYISTPSELLPIIQQNYQAAIAEKGFLESLVQSRGTVPQLILQAEIPSYILPSRRKFSLRSYVLILVSSTNLTMHLYSDIEVRLAAVPMSDDCGVARDRSMHITNGAGKSDTTRCLLTDVPELLTFSDRVAAFMTTLFGTYLRPEIVENARVDVEGIRGGAEEVRSCLAGVDLMIDSGECVKLLEINVNPAAPPENVVGGEFRDHLVTFGRELVTVTKGEESGKFERIAFVKLGE